MSVIRHVIRPAWRAQKRRRLTKLILRPVVVSSV
jgi:hypothetical protein